MSGSLLDTGFTGASEFHWWFGQIVDESHWIGNVNTKIHNRDDVPGWGSRYKVAIMGYHDIDKKIPDDQLPWAEVILPVTAGSGHGGSAQSANLRQGSFVFGFFRDGINATEPIILGTIPNDSQIRLMESDSSQNFSPRSGFYGKGGTKVIPTKNMYSTGPASTPAAEAHPACQKSDVAQKDQQADGSRCHFIPKIEACEGLSSKFKGIQLTIKNLLALIQRIKAEINNFISAATDITKTISGIVNDAVNFISSLVKAIIAKIRAYVMNKINAGISDLIALLPISQRPNANKAAQTANNTLNCVFNKIIKGLVTLIKTLLESIIDKYINAPMCAVENFVGNILGNILGPITDGINQAISSITSALGSITGVAGKIFSALDIISGILKFLSCEETQDCTMGDQWSFWGGAKCATETAKAGIGSFYNKVLSGIASVGGATSTSSCSTSAIPCGPPSLSITGGGGSGVLGNPIISATGQVLGIDLKNGGTFTGTPSIGILDGCGNGGGAIAIAVMKPAGIGSTGAGIGSTAAGIGSTAAGIGSTAAGIGSTAAGIGSTAAGIGSTAAGIGSTAVPFLGISSVTLLGISSITILGVSTNPSFLGVSSVSLTGIGSLGIATESPLGISSAYLLDVGITTAFLGISSISLSGIGTLGIITQAPPGISSATLSVIPQSSPGISSVTLPVEQPIYTIDKIVILDPGSGYLNAPNGDLGGNGYVWARSNETIVQRSNGNYDTPYPPGKIVNLNPGDTIQYPGSSPVTVSTNESITTPPYDANKYDNISLYPSTSNGTYPVMLYIEDAIITNTGVAYLSDDKIEITPDHGAVLEPTFDSQGRLVNVSVVSSGIGFTEYPSIVVKTTQGMNAKIVPVFGISRIGDLPQSQDTIPVNQLDKLIHVVDVPEKSGFVQYDQGIINVVDRIGVINV